MVLHLLEDDPTLEPRDVIVMCPDIETFAPLIQATFGSGRHADDDDDEDEADDAAQDGCLTYASGSPTARCARPIPCSASSASCSRSPTSARPRHSCSTWPGATRSAGGSASTTTTCRGCRNGSPRAAIRWGFDAPHREPFKLGSLHANTWRRGLDRMLVGVAMTEEDSRLVQGVLPLDDVDSGAIDLAGRFAEFVDRVKAAADALTDPKPIATLGRRDRPGRRLADRHQRARLLAATRAAAPARGRRRGVRRRRRRRGGGPELELADVRVLLADRLRGRPTRANFRTGHLTVCTLVPMRSVPHRVVCVLGLDDGEFPRRTRRDGDDLLLAEPHVGDRDPRTEDRQMLLDALMAATERLIITYTGDDERTNVRRPPAVPVGELLDVVDRTVRSETGSPRDQIVVHHPLQPFDPRNFVPGKLVPDRPWSFDPQALAGARALEAPPQPRRRRFCRRRSHPGPTP